MGLGVASVLMKSGILSSDADQVTIDSITLFVALLCACIVIGYLIEENRWFNESFTSLVIGLCTGVVILLTSGGKSSRILEFDEEFFFIYLLPPIIFNAGFQVKKKQFFRNFIIIMLFGVVGTLISFATIAIGASQLFKKLDIGFLEMGDYLAIGAILSATDSVCTLQCEISMFAAIGAILSATDSVCTLQVLNQDETPLLYSLVFGEGVVNDATSVVLFNAIQKFDISQMNSGLVWQFIGNFLHSTDREVALMSLMAYLSYVMAELFDLSGILTVFICGIVMSHYTWHNVTESSRVTTKHGFATLSFIAEIFIFVYVGMDALDIEKWSFVSKSPGKSVGVSSILLGLVLVGRAAFVLPLSFLINLTKKSDSEKISFKQQITVWWAGLMRGAVSMALAYSQFAKSGHTQLPGNAIMITSTITVVLFSTLVFGTLTKPLVYFLLPPLKHSSSMTSSEPSSPKSFTLPLLGNGQEDSEADTGIHSIPRPTSLRMLLSTPTHTVHHYWRKFDDAFMRPVFGGRGFVPYVPGSPIESSLQ
ncbi:hypothetical protein TEA_010957 [Camellia sinensis var. sinensis]|uniref:Cation/H+ exchanger transmembrane domain-containing protein n=1 Tax=Camellia sinensis var. sinensis TaxID=542762 RepID=A0A4S4D5Q0_CAMSN|nr:hypothetical protein TEA_010957 [Camellia sinensis var. sinensis]